MRYIGMICCCSCSFRLFYLNVANVGTVVRTKIHISKILEIRHRPLNSNDFAQAIGFNIYCFNVHLSNPPQSYGNGLLSGISVRGTSLSESSNPSPNSASFSMSSNEFSSFSAALYSGCSFELSIVWLYEGTFSGIGCSSSMFPKISCISGSSLKMSSGSSGISGLSGFPGSSGLPGLSGVVTSIQFAVNVNSPVLPAGIEAGVHPANVHPSTAAGATGKYSADSMVYTWRFCGLGEPCPFMLYLMKYSRRFQRA